MCLLTIKDFELMANLEKIPILLEFDKELCVIYVTCFKRDEIRLKELFHNHLPISVRVEYNFVSEYIKYSQKSMLEYLNGDKLNA